MLDMRIEVELPHRRYMAVKCVINTVVALISIFLRLYILNAVCAVLELVTVILLLTYVLRLCRAYLISHVALLEQSRNSPTIGTVVDLTIISTAVAIAGTVLPLLYVFRIGNNLLWSGLTIWIACASMIELIAVALWWRYVEKSRNMCRR